MNVNKIIMDIEKEIRHCTNIREQKIEQRDCIATSGWDGKIQGLNMALSIIRESNAGDDRK